MTPALAWLFLGLIGFLLLALGYAFWDASRHPERWFSGPSLDDRERERRGQS